MPRPTPAGPARVARWLEERRRLRARPQNSYASLEAAAARLREGDPRLDPALALRLAERGTALGPDGRRRFKHDPLHAAARPCGFDPEHARPFWARVACPVLMLEGEHSEFRLPGEEARRRWASFRELRSAVVPGAGHMVQRHRPAEVARLLVEFLGSADGRAAR